MHIGIVATSGSGTGFFFFFQRDLVVSVISIIPPVPHTCSFIADTSFEINTPLNLLAPCVLYIGQAFRYSPENAFYILNQQIYFII